VKFYAMISSNESLESHVFLQYLDLTNFLKIWDAYMRLKFIPLANSDKIPPSCLKPRPRSKLVQS
jgi:hypothetical protein